MRADGTQLDVTRPQVRSDSIVGFDGFDLSLVLAFAAWIVDLQPHYRGLF